MTLPICPAQTSVSDRFYQAIRNDNAGELKALLDSQDVNAKDSRGATPLMYAAAFGNARQMKLLLEAGADVTRETPSMRRHLSGQAVMPSSLDC
jgi:ankyrin repeat protein